MLVIVQIQWMMVGLIILSNQRLHIRQREAQLPEGTAGNSGGAVGMRLEGAMGIAGDEGSIPAGIGG